MSWPRPSLPEAGQEAAARRMLNDATEQLAQGNPQQALSIVMNLLSAMHLPQEAAAAALKVRQAMADDPNRDVTAQLAGLLGSLSLTTATATALPPPAPPPAQEMQGLHLQETFHSSIDVDMMAIDGGLEPAGAAAAIGQATADSSGQRLQALSLAADGEASYVCVRCGAVISVARRAAHEEAWCPAVTGSGGGGSGRDPGG